MIMEATRENDRLYERVMDENQSKRPRSPLVIPSSKLKGCTTASTENIPKKLKTVVGAKSSYENLKSSTGECGKVSVDVIVQTSNSDNVGTLVNDDLEDPEVAELKNKFPLIMKVADALGDLDEPFLDDLLQELLVVRQNKGRPSVTYKNRKNNQYVSYVKVPVNTTDQSFQETKCLDR